MQRLSKGVSIVLGAALVSGCASFAERDAFSAYRKEARARRAIRLDGSTYSARKLPRLDAKATLSDYLAYAALRNNGVAAAFYRWKAALERAPQVRSLPEPKFTYGYFIREVETRVGPQRHKFSLTQVIPWPGKLSWRAKLAVQAARMRRQEYEAAKLKLFYRVKKAYYEYYYLGRSIAITKENMVLLSYLERAARAMYTVGKASHADIVKAQVELARLEDRIRTLKALRQPLMAELNAALNRRSKQILPWPRKMLGGWADVPVQKLSGLLKRNNPKLKRLDFQIARQRAAIRLARQGYFPDLALNVGVIETGPARMAGTSGSGKDPIIASLSIRIPIWIGKYRAAEREARAGYLAAVRQRRQLEHDLEARFKLVLFRFQDARRKVELYQKSLIPKAEQAFAVTQRTFSLGKSDFLDVIDSQRTLLEFRLAYERAVADRGRWLARLEELVGKPVVRRFKKRKTQPAPDGKSGRVAGRPAHRPASGTGQGGKDAKEARPGGSDGVRRKK